MSECKRADPALIHGCIYGDTATSAGYIPIYQTSTYEQKGIGENNEREYSRTGNPIGVALKALITELEGGKEGFASGLATIATVLSLFELHASIPKDIRDKVSIHRRSARLSIGSKNIGDILSDIDNAIYASEE